MAKRTIEEENVIIGKKLQNARERHGVHQSEMCVPCGLTKNHISAVERGVSKASIKMLMGYCEKLGTTPNDILGYEDISIIPDLKALLAAMDEEQQNRLVKMIKLMSES